VLLAGDADGNLCEIRENAEEFVLTRQIAVAPATSLIRLFPASDGRTVCVIDGNWNLAVVDRETGTIRSRFKQTLIAVMLPDREHLIRSLAGTNEMEIVPIRDGNVCRTLKGHQSTISRIVITPDGQTCITTSHDRTIRLWNVSDWTERQELRGHSSPIIAMAMTHSGRLFATADESGVIKLWDTESARELTELDEHAPLLLELKFSHDTSQLIGWDAEQRIYSMSL
jgi:WD40 repeat protein